MSLFEDDIALYFSFKVPAPVYSHLSSSLKEIAEWYQNNEI
jgi:hypothetical protein